MKTVVAALCAIGALALAGVAGADPLRYGAADDWPKGHPCGDVFWQSMKEIGYQDLRLTIQWDGGAAIPYEDNVRGAVDCALLNDIRPILAVYPAKPNLIGGDDGAQNAFAAFVSLTGTAFPQVKDFIVGNEPNVNRFWQPQYAGGRSAAPVDNEHTLAKSYDALKSVRPDSVVWGPAVSSRGNDNAAATSNPSHSPVSFIVKMGQEYRQSGRSAPLFDEFDMHPYPPVQDTDSYAKKFQWPQAGAANLDRIKQALWDAFDGTAQATPAERGSGQTAAFAGEGLPLNLDEAGSQTTVAGHDGAYRNPPESIVAVDEAKQAWYHVELAEIAACDPSVTSLLFFPLIDEDNIHDGFQSGNLYADLEKKQSYAAVQGKIASAKGECQGGVGGVPQAWKHTVQVVGAQSIFGGPGTVPGSRPGNKPGTQQYWAFSVTAGEDATYSAGLFQVPSAAGAPLAEVARGLTSARRSPKRKAAAKVASTVGVLKAYYKPLVKFPGRRLQPGYYVYGITLAATANPERTTTLVSKAFKVGKPAAAKAKPKPKPKARPKPAGKQATRPT